MNNSYYSPTGTPAANRIAHHESVLERVKALPGVQAVGAINGLFELGEANNLGLRSIEGRAVERREQWTVTFTRKTGAKITLKPARI